MKNKYLILVAVLLISACGNRNNIVIEGTLANGAGKTIYIEDMTPDTRLFLDSIKLDNKGYFRFKYHSTVFRIPLSKFSSARQPSSFSILVASMA